MHQTHEFARSEDEGAFVLVSGDLVILEPVVGFVLQVVHFERIGTEDEVVTHLSLIS